MITVGIVHYRKLGKLTKTIDCLRKYTRSPFELRIFNNGYESDGIAEYLDTLEIEGVKVIRHPSNIGCSPARKLLFENITTPFILSLDDDMYVTPEWDVPVLEFMQKHKDVGAIGFSFVNPDGSRNPGGKMVSCRSGVVRLHAPPSGKGSFVEVDDVPAGAMLYRRELNPIIDWDPAFFIGFEDLDKGLRLKASTYRCYAYQANVFTHDTVSRDSRAVAYNRVRRDYHALRRSYLHFVRKHGIRMDWKRHIFYKYICLLPNAVLQKAAYYWLKGSQ